MDERIENTFLTQLFVQCDTAIIFAADLKQAVQKKDDPRIWCSVQGFLVSAANISKMLWPSESATSPVSKERGSRLRAILSVPDTSILRDKKFRNHFEHFDERLDKWAESQKTSPSGLIDGWVAYSKVNFETETVGLLRVFDATDFSLMFYGERYALEPVMKAVSQLQAKVQAVARERLDQKKAKATKTRLPVGH